MVQGFLNYTDNNCKQKSPLSNKGLFYQGLIILFFLQYIQISHISGNFITIHIQLG
jgi:hypothetical protein